MAVEVVVRVRCGGAQGQPVRRHTADARGILEADLAEFEYLDLLDDSDLLEFVRKYGVNRQALVNRLKNLGYIEE